MEYKKQLEDLSHIRQIMEQQTKFISLSGLSGILAGSYAIIGAYFAYKTAHYSNRIIYKDIEVLRFSEGGITLISIALLVLIASIATGLYLSHQKAHKAGEKLWNASAKKMMLNFIIPLITGGFFIIILLWKGHLSMIASATLIFYGLALYSSSQFTYSDIKKLAYFEIILGLIAAAYPGYGLIFWTLGFGVLHIIYGSILYFKYDKSIK